MKLGDLGPMPFPPSWYGGPPDPPAWADYEPDDDPAEWEEPIGDAERDADEDYRYRTEGP